MYSYKSPSIILRILYNYLDYFIIRSSCHWRIVFLFILRNIHYYTGNEKEREREEEIVKRE